MIDDRIIAQPHLADMRSGFGNGETAPAQYSVFGRKSGSQMGWLSDWRSWMGMLPRGGWSMWGDEWWRYQDGVWPP
jgi:hypothetical protein